ncbi:MAG: class I SAM-dependent methyltransferase [Planctomycetales bacterium]|nr:class I SAM-dependent methyltransferase [Planctomycetales bacterium]
MIEPNQVAVVEIHNQKAAAMWGRAGRDYERISETIADSIEHCVTRLGPRTGERILDVATGTGWTARRVAVRGAKVVGVDIGSELIEAATAIASEEDLPIEFRVGDAEKLPFKEGEFDAAVSTCGVMFATKPEAAAAELGRVVRKGGRVAITAWVPGSAVAGIFQIVRGYLPPPPAPPAPSPFEWGRPERVRELLGRTFDLRFETGTSWHRDASGEAAWELFVHAYGPTKTLAAGLEPARREAFHKEFVAFHEKHRNDLGIAVPREYLLTVGVRK